MVYNDGNRIRSNAGGLNVIRSLRDANRRVQMHQLRLATGKRINHASDDAAGMHRTVTLSARSRTLSQVMQNIGEAQHMLEPAESGLQGMQQLLAETQARIMQSANGTLSDDDRRAVTQSIIHLRDEIDAISNETSFNGVNLLGSATTHTFQTGETSQTSFTSGAYGVNDLGMSNLSNLTSDDVINSDNYQGYLDEVTSAMSTVSSGLTDIGSMTNRLSHKESMISVQHANVTAVLSRIEDADMATEQLNLVKAKIAQQGALAVLNQRNVSAGAVLNLQQR